LFAAFARIARSRASAFPSIQRAIGITPEEAARADFERDEDARSAEYGL